MPQPADTTRSSTTPSPPASGPSPAGDRRLGSLTCRTGKATIGFGAGLVVGLGLIGGLVAGLLATTLGTAPPPGDAPAASEPEQLRSGIGANGPTCVRPRHPATADGTDSALGRAPYPEAVAIRSAEAGPYQVAIFALS